MNTENGVTFGSHRSLRQNSYLSLLSLRLSGLFLAIRKALFPEKLKTWGPVEMPWGMGPWGTGLEARALRHGA